MTRSRKKPAVEPRAAGKRGSLEGKGDRTVDDADFDAVTAVPSVPIAQYVRAAMAQAEAAESGADPSEPTPLTEDQPEKLELESPLDSIPPAAPRESALSVDGEDDATRDWQGLDGADDGIEREEAPADQGESGAPPLAADPALAELHEKFASGDYTGTLKLAEKLRSVHPGDLTVESYLETCRGVLEQSYSAPLGDLDRVVVLAVPPDHLRWLSLDHRAGFLLSLVDGTCTLAEILDISGMPRVDALRIARSLVEQRIIGFASG